MKQGKRLDPGTLLFKAGAVSSDSLFHKVLFSLIQFTVLI